MIKREWIDRSLAGTVARKHCNECNQDAMMEYHQTYERDNGDVRDVYKCIADCSAKWKYESQNPDLKFVHPLFGFPHNGKKL
jgi:hypothetical protein